MPKTMNDMPAKVRGAMVTLLNARLADSLDLRSQVKVAHWNVKGPNFIAVHRLFDEVVEGFDEYSDLLAERAVQLGGTAEGTVRVVAKNTSLDEYGAASGREEHVQAVADALADFGKSVRAAIDKASKAGDQGTADLFTEVSRGTDKWLWFVEAHLDAREKQARRRR